MTPRPLTVVADDRVTAADLFTAEQLAALRAAGYGVRFVRAADVLTLSFFGSEPRCNSTAVLPADGAK